MTLLQRSWSTATMKYGWKSREKIVQTKAQFNDEDALMAAVTNIAQSVGRTINTENPRLDARLPNGYRVHAVIPPCSRKGTTLAIRKFSSEQFTFKDYIKFGAMTGTVAEFLKIAGILGKKYRSQRRNRFR